MHHIKWVWDPQKALRNLVKHGLSFELAELVFDDPYQLSLPDPEPSEERWRTVGQVHGVTIFVVHSTPEPNPETGNECGRIISARKATRTERLAYENG